jgi:gas vesicle protein
MNNVNRPHKVDSSTQTQGNTLASVFVFFTGLLIGVLSGTVATLLLAPRSGRKTRARIQHQVQELRNRAVESVEDAEEEMSERAELVAATVRDTVEDVQKRGKAMLNER